MTFLLGIVFGIALAFLFGYGASFFAMVQTSAQYGFRRTVYMVYGVILSDVVMIGAMLTVLASVVGLDNLSSALQTPWVLTVGSIVLIAMGIFTMTLKAKEPVARGEKFAEKVVQNAPQRLNTLFWRGFALNFFNPLVWIFWLSIVIVMTPIVDNDSVGRVYLFFVGVMLAELGCNILKCWLSERLLGLFSVRFRNGFNKFVGTVIIGFAIYILFALVIFRDKQPERETPQPANVIMGVVPQQLIVDSNHHSDTISATTSMTSN